MPQDDSQKLNELETEIRILREKINDGDKLLTVRIEALDKRNEALRSSVEGTKEFVDKRARMLGLGSVFGLPLALMILFWVIYSTGKPIAEEAAKEAAKSIDWQEQVESVANAEVQKLVTPEVLTKAIDKRSIETAASSVIDSPTFQESLRRTVEANADLFKPTQQHLTKLAGETLDKFRPEIEHVVVEQVKKRVAEYKVDQDMLTSLIGKRIEQENGFLEAEVIKAVEAALNERVESLRSGVSVEVAKQVKALDLKEFVSAELLQKLIQQYVTESLTEDEQFIARVKSAVVTTLDAQLLDSKRFEEIVRSQVDAERARIRELAKSASAIGGNDRVELSSTLSKVFLGIDNAKLRKNIVMVSVHPFEDSLVVSTSIFWFPEEDESKRYSVSIKIGGLNTTTPELQKIVEQYVGRKLADTVVLYHSSSEKGKRFAAGDGSSRDFSTHDLATEFAVDSIIDLVDDCFGIEYPAKWRVSFIAAL